jgi:hypothetical protein
MQINKTDQNDAEGLAQIVAGWYGLFMSSRSIATARVPSGRKDQLVGRLIIQHIRGVLKTFGLLPGAMRGLLIGRLKLCCSAVPMSGRFCSRCGRTRAVTVFRDPLSEGFRHFVLRLLRLLPAGAVPGGLAPTGSAAFGAQSK